MRVIRDDLPFRIGADPSPDSNAFTVSDPRGLLTVHIDRDLREFSEQLEAFRQLIERALGNGYVDPDTGEFWPDAAQWSP